MIAILIDQISNNARLRIAINNALPFADPATLAKILDIQSQPRVPKSSAVEDALDTFELLKAQARLLEAGGDDKKRFAEWL
jgi:hypothetical protein